MAREQGDKTKEREGTGFNLGEAGGGSLLCPVWDGCVGEKMNEFFISLIFSKLEFFF